MPTIDELAPATAAADSDELPVSQNLITRKITRAQVLAGLQSQLNIPAGTLLGRISSGLGPPETIAVGNYLSLSSGTLAALAAPYSIALSPGGTVPSTGNLVPLSQDGVNVAVSYSVFFHGLSAISTINGSQLLITPTGATNSLKLADLASSVITKSGGSLSGPLALAGDPSTPLQASTKQYTDLKINRTGDTLTGPLQLTGDPTIALQAATKNYVDTNSNLLRLGLTMTGPIVLSGDPTTALNPATKSYTDTRLFRGGDTMTGLLGLSTAPVLAWHAATKGYVDSEVSTSLPLNGGNLGGPLTLFADPATPLQAATKQYADAKVSRSGDTMVGLLSLAASPTSPFHAATKNYVDNQLLTALPMTGGTMTGPVFLSGNPTSSSQAATKYYVDGGLAGALPLGGGTVTGPITLNVSPALPPHVANKQYVDSQLSGFLPLSGGSLSGILALAFSPTASGAAAIRLQAGQTVAFEPTNSISLGYASTSNAIVAKYGATTCAIGRGISVSFGIIFSSSATISASSSGSIVFLLGVGAYTITLPPAASVTAGTGFTFSAIGTGTVTIMSASGDTLDLSPITLRQYDRYHIISDGASLWREIFKSNSVSPHFAGTPVLPSYSVTTLPGTPEPGATAFATNGRKPNEAASAGTGVAVFYDGTKWISACSGSLVTA